MIDADYTESDTESHLFVNINEWRKKDKDFGYQLLNWRFESRNKFITFNKILCMHLKEDLLATGIIIPSKDFSPSSEPYDFPRIIDDETWYKTINLNDLKNNRTTSFLRSINNLKNGKNTTFRFLTFPVIEMAIFDVQEDFYEINSSTEDIDTSVKETIPSENSHECIYKQKCIELEEKIRFLEDKLVENDRKSKKRESDQRRNYNLTSPAETFLSPVRKQICFTSPESGQTPKRRKFVTPNWDSVVASVDQFAGRESRNGLKPNLVYFVIGMITHNQLSYRQTAILLDVLNQTMPIFKEFLVDVNFPTKSSIFRIAQCLPVINIHYIIQRIENASNIVIAMDGSSKRGTSYFAVILNDGLSTPFALQAQRSCDGTAQGEARLAISMIKDIFYTAKEFNLALKDESNWIKNVFQKISGLMSDSCNTANAMKKAFAELVREETGNEDQIITSLDCSMHYIGVVFNRFLKILQQFLNA
jgi:hypothetical protein